MIAAYASALVGLTDEYDTLAALTASNETRRLVRDAQAQLEAILDGYVSGRVDDDEAGAWLDAGRLTLARLRAGRPYLDETLDRIRLAHGWT